MRGLHYNPTVGVSRTAARTVAGLKADGWQGKNSIRV
jgi:hypothetical protein